MKETRAVKHWVLSKMLKEIISRKLILFNKVPYETNYALNVLWKALKTQTCISDYVKYYS